MADGQPSFTAFAAAAARAAHLIIDDDRPIFADTLERRAELGLPAGDGALLLVDPETEARVDPGAVPLHLRRAQVTRVSIEANAGICRGMLRHRYHSPGQGETVLSQAPEEDP
jgi:hypothetical protein